MLDRKLWDKVNYLKSIGTEFLWWLISALLTTAYFWAFTTVTKPPPFHLVYWKQFLHCQVVPPGYWPGMPFGHLTRLDLYILESLHGPLYLCYTWNTAKCFQINSGFEKLSQIFHHFWQVRHQTSFVFTLYFKETKLQPLKWVFKERLLIAVIAFFKRLKSKRSHSEIERKTTHYLKTATLMTGRKDSYL